MPGSLRQTPLFLSWSCLLSSGWFIGFDGSPQKSAQLRATGRREFKSAIGNLKSAMSLIGSPVVFEPTRDVLPGRVVMRPMNGAAFFVPLVDAVETYTVTFL